MTTETQDTDTTTTEAAPATEAAQETTAEGMTDAGRRALAKQAAEFRAQIAELAKFKEAAEAEAKAKAEAEAVAKGEFEKVLAEREAALAELKATIAAKDRQIVEGAARDALRAAGMTQDLMLRGAIAGLPADATADNVDTWLEEFKAANAEAFVATVRGVKPTTAGAPAVGASRSSSIEQLRADLRDPAKAREAAAELEARIMRGETID